jgi:flagellar basal-body rod protein FlgB
MLCGMDPTRINLLDLAEQSMVWADQRQAVLAQNIANANTPGFKPHDLRPFAEALANAGAVAPVRTDPNHLAGTLATTSPGEVVDRTHMKSPDGNAVALDEQLVKVADTDTTHQLVTTIYKTYLGMFKTAMGSGSSS